METGVRMTPRQMKAVHDEHVGAENRKDLDAAMATYHEECFYHNVPLGFRVVGRDEIRAYYTTLMTTFPDSVLDVQGEAYGDDVMVAYGTFRATAAGAFLGVEPTGKRIALPVVAILTFKDGLMSGEHLMYDLATLCDQAGVPIEQPRGATAGFRRHEPWV